MSKLSNERSDVKYRKNTLPKRTFFLLWFYVFVILRTFFVIFLRSRKWERSEIKSREDTICRQKVTCVKINGAFRVHDNGFLGQNYNYGNNKKKRVIVNAIHFSFKIANEIKQNVT